MSNKSLRCPKKAMDAVVEPNRRCHSAKRHSRKVQADHSKSAGLDETDGAPALISFNKTQHVVQYDLETLGRPLSSIYIKA